MMGSTEPLPLDHATIYLRPIHRGLANKREEEKATIERFLKSGTLDLLPDDEITIIHESNGAPYFSKEIGLGVSISHSDHILAVAIYPDKYRAGIDIEERVDQAAKLIRRVSSESELALMHIYNLPPILLWSAKEAVFKAYSDKIMTMSGQVILKECRPKEQKMILNVLEDHGRQTLAEVRYLNTFNLAKQTDTDHSPPSIPFVLTFASNIPNVQIMINAEL